MNTDDLQRMLQHAAPDDHVPILIDCHLELVAGFQAEEDADRVAYQWRDGDSWSMNGAASSLDQFLDAVVEPAIRRGAQLVQRDH